MGINPIQSMGEIRNIKGLKGVEETVGYPNNFKDVFDDAIKDYVNNENEVDSDIAKIATGEDVDLHNLMINMQKTEISLEFLVQMRNKTLDAYEELMRTTI